MSSYVASRPPMGLQSTLALSPDGAMAAHADDHTGQLNVAIAPLDAGATRRLTSFTDRTVRQFAWHPNGKPLMFAADRDGAENSQLYLVDVDGQEIRQLTDASDVQHVAARGNPISPNGQLSVQACGDAQWTTG